MIPWADAAELPLKLVAMKCPLPYHLNRVHLIVSAGLGISLVATFTLDHPTLIGCNPHNGAYSTCSDSRDSFMHTAVYFVSVGWHHLYHGNLLPSMFPCSVSTAIQSYPQRAIVLL